MTVGALTSAHVGTAYTATATSTLVQPDDGSYTKVWSMTSVGGAAGLQIDASTGAITGTPTAAGSYTVKQAVTDGGGNTVEGTTTLTVSATMAAMASHYQPVIAAETPAPTKKAKKSQKTK